MVTSTRRAFVAGLVVLALTAAAVASPSAADEKDDLQRQKRGVSGQVGDAKKSLDESSKKFAGAVAALKKAQAQLDAAEAHLGSTRGELATAEARDAQMQAELIKSEAELDVAIDKLAQGKKELKSSEVRVQQFTVESLQEGDRGLQAFGDLLRGESPTQFSQKMSLSDSVSDAQLATMQRLAASKVILQLNRKKVQALRDQVAAARKAAAANLVLKQQLEASAENQAEEVDRLVGQREDARSSAAAIKREDEKQLRELENERARLNARLAALAAKDRKSGGKGAGGDGGGTLSRPVGGPDHVAVRHAPAPDHSRLQAPRRHRLLCRVRHTDPGRRRGQDHRAVLQRWLRQPRHPQQRHQARQEHRDDVQPPLAIRQEQGRPRLARRGDRLRRQHRLLDRLPPALHGDRQRPHHQPHGLALTSCENGPVAKETGRKIVAQNKKARHDFHIEDTYEAGLVLTGTEVKSLRAGRASLVDGFGEVEKGEAWLLQVHIPEYTQGTWTNHETRRRRKMLLNRHEIDRIEQRVNAKGLTIVPLALYFKDGRAKVEIALARGKKQYDKRHAIAERQAKADAQREVGRRLKGME